MAIRRTTLELLGANARGHDMQARNGIPVDECAEQGLYADLCKVPVTTRWLVSWCGWVVGTLLLVRWDDDEMGG